MKECLIENPSQAHRIAYIIDALIETGHVRKEDFSFTKTSILLNLCFDNQGTGLQTSAICHAGGFKASGVVYQAGIQFDNTGLTNHWEHKTEEARRKYCGGNMGIRNGEIKRGKGRYSSQ